MTERARPKRKTLIDIIGAATTGIIAGFIGGITGNVLYGVLVGLILGVGLGWLSSHATD